MTTFDQTDEVAIPSTRGIAAPTKRQIEPFDLLLIVASFGAALWVIDPIYDINDVFWHVLVGDQIRQGVPFSELGSAFSFAWENTDWRTGAWGSELLMSWLYELGGWKLLVNVLRLVTVLSVCLILWRSVVVRFPSRAVIVPYFLAILALVLAVQERPQSLSFIFITLAGVWWYQSAVEGRPPHWFLAGVMAALWANLHGLWVVLPAVLLLSLIGRALDHGHRDPARKPAGAALLASLLGGLATPLGIYGLLLPFQIQGAAADLVSEWELTALFAWPGYALLLSGGLTLYLVGRVRGLRAELVYTVAVIVFGLMAVRNVTPAVLLLTPLLTSLIARALGSRSLTSVTEHERARLRSVAWGLTTVGVLAVMATVALRPQGPPDTLPISLASQLAEEPGEVRLLNDYNLSGIALFYGSSEVKVAVDGRTDFYGAEYLDQYQDAILYGKDLDALIQDLHPTHALLQSDSAAAILLRSQGWTTIGSDLEAELLVAP